MKVIRLIIGIMFIALLACNKPASQGKPVLLATIHPYELILSQLAGSEFEIHSIIPANASPHTWSPTPADLRAMSSASFILSNGMQLEANLQKNLTGYDEKHVEAATLLKDLIVVYNEEHAKTDHQHPDEAEEHSHEADTEEDEHHHSQDPHLWTSPRLMIRLVGKLEKELSKRYPNSELLFKHNAETICKELEAVNARISQERAGFVNPAIITYHNSFHYFTQDYAVRVLGWVQASPGKEATPAELAKLGQSIKDNSVKAIFIEPQMNPKAGEVLAKEFKLKLLTLDPIGSSVQANTIAELILANWENMTQGF